MHSNRLRHWFLALCAGLMIVNLTVMLSPQAHAFGKVQYKAVQVRGQITDLQSILDQMSAEGWEYVGSIGDGLIFKK